MMRQRIFYGALLIGVLVVIFWGDLQFARGAVGAGEPGGPAYGTTIPLTVTLLAIAGAYETLLLTRAAGYATMAGVVLVGVVLLNVLAWWVPAVNPDARDSVWEWQLVVLVLCSMVVGLVQIIRHRTQRGIADISVSIMILIYMGILPSFMIALRAALPGSDGAFAVLLFIAVVKCTDIAAYFTGSALGKTKLIPAISSGKTVEGLAGGVVAAIAASLLLTRWLPFSEALGASFTTLQATLFGLLMAFLGQLGDLVESVFKRDAESKDSGRVIPAFGGVLDLLDSPVFAAPLGYLLLSAWLGSHNG